MKAKKTKTYATITRTFALASDADYDAFEAALKAVDQRMSPWDAWKTYERFSALRMYTKCSSWKVNIETLDSPTGYTSVFFHPL